MSVPDDPSGSKTTDGTTVARLRWLSSLLNPWAIRAAATLRLPDLIAGGIDTTAELATQSGTDTDALRRLLRHLALLDVVRGAGADRWALGALGAVLRDDHPARLRRTLDQDDRYLGMVDASTSGLLASVRTGTEAWRGMHGRTFWEQMKEDPAFGGGFDALMDHYSRQLGTALANGYAWDGVGHVVDVGGGVGRVLASILAAHPGTRGTLLDLPETVAAAPPVLRENGVESRCAVAAGSFFDELPADGDVYLLVNVVHNWNDEGGLRILRRCADAAGPGGRVLLVERLVPADADAEERLVASSKDLYMLLLLGGRERTAQEHYALAARVGLVPAGAAYPLPDHRELSLLNYTVAH